MVAREERQLSAAARVEDARTNTTSHPTGVAAPPLAGSRAGDPSLVLFDAEDPFRMLGSQSARPHDGWHVEHIPLETSIDDGQSEVSYGEDAGIRTSKLNTTETTDETEISLASEGSSCEGFGPSQYMRRVRRRRKTFIFCMFVPFAASAISFALLLAKQERLANREAELAVANQSGVSSIQGEDLEEKESTYATEVFKCIICDGLEEEQSRDEPHQNEEHDDTRNDGVDIESQSVYMEETIGPSLMSSDGPSAPPSSTPSPGPSLEPTYLPTRDPTTR